MAGIDDFSRVTYSQRLGLAAQRLTSDLMSTAIFEPLTGKKRFFDHYGVFELDEITGRAAETVIDEMPRNRRMISRKRYGKAILLDKDDHIDLAGLFEPNAGFNMALMAAIARKVDLNILAAYDGTSFTGEDGTTSQAFDTNNSFVADGNQLGGTKEVTTQNVTKAGRILDVNNVPRDDDRFIVHDPEVLEQMLGQTALEPASSDYNSVHALIRRELRIWAGFRWIQHTGITEHGTNLKYAFFGHKAGMVYGIERMGDIRVKTEVETFNFSTMVAAFVNCAATRGFETHVGRIEHDVV